MTAAMQRLAGTASPVCLSGSNPGPAAGGRSSVACCPRVWHAARPRLHAPASAPRSEATLILHPAPAQEYACPQAGLSMDERQGDSGCSSPPQQHPAGCPASAPSEPLLLLQGPAAGPFDNKAFVKSLRDVRTLADLRAAVHAAVGHSNTVGPPLDARSVTAIGSVLLRLLGQLSDGAALPTARLQHFAALEWLPMVYSSLNVMDEPGLCVAMHAAVRLRVAASGALEPLARAWASVHAPNSTPRTQATVLWCVASVGLPVPPAWLRRWTAVSARSLHAYGLQDMSMALFALARIQHGPPASWTRQLVAALETRLVEDEAGGGAPQGAAAPVSSAGSPSSLSAAARLSSLAGIMWALARLRLLPQPQLVDTLLDVAARSMTEVADARPHHTPGMARSLSALAHGLMCTQHQPRPAFLAAFIHASQRCMDEGATAPQDLAMISISACHWRMTPPLGWMRTLEAASGAVLPKTTVQGLVLTLDAFAQLRYRPHEAWLRRWAASLGRSMPALPPAAAAQLIAALAALGVRPHPALHRALWEAMAREAHYVRAKRVFPALLGAALLGHTQALWGVEHVWTAALDKLVYCHPTNLSHVAWAAVLWRRGNGGGNEWDPGGDVPHAWCPPSRFVPALLAAARQKLCVAQPCDLASLLAALAVMSAKQSAAGGWLGGGRFMTAGELAVLLRAAALMLPSFTLSQLAGLLRSAVQLGGSCLLGTQKDGGADDDDAQCAACMREICMQCLKLALEQGQQAGQEEPGASYSGMEHDDGQGAGPRFRADVGPKGVRRVLLQAALAVAEAEGMLSPGGRGAQGEQQVVQTWQLLVDAGFFAACQPLRKRQALCLALATAACQVQDNASTNTLRVQQLMRASGVEAGTHKGDAGTLLVAQAEEPFVVVG